MSATRLSRLRFILIGLLVLAFLLTVFFFHELQRTQHYSVTPSISNHGAAGINVDVLLEDFSATPAEFASFGTQAVHTFKPSGVNTYEVLNEVNTYTPTITASDYVQILKAVYPAIKAADSSASVLMSGLDSSSKPDVYLQAMYDAGAKGYFDAVNAHPYSYPDMPAPTHCLPSNAFIYRRL